MFTLFNSLLLHAAVFQTAINLPGRYQKLQFLEANQKKLLTEIINNLTLQS